MTAMLILRVATLVAPLASFAVSVIRCAPTLSVPSVNEVPLPICPLRLLVHTNDAPPSTPSSGSDAEPANVSAVPCGTEIPLAGDEILTEGT